MKSELKRILESKYKAINENLDSKSKKQISETIEFIIEDLLGEHSDKVHATLEAGDYSDEQIREALKKMKIKVSL